LIVELERLFIDQLVVETFAISRLDDVTLGVDAVLVAFQGRCLVLALELFLLFDCVSVVVDEASGRRHFEFMNTSVV